MSRWRSEVTSLHCEDPAGQKLTVRLRGSKLGDGFLSPLLLSHIIKSLDQYYCLQSFDFQEEISTDQCKNIQIPIFRLQNLEVVTLYRNVRP